MVTNHTPPRGNCQLRGPKGLKKPGAKGVGPARVLCDENSGVVGPAKALLMTLVASLMGNRSH